MSRHITAGTIGWITEESLWRLRNGGNGSKGTVPIHKKRSVTSRYAVFCSVASLTKVHIRKAGGIVHSDGNVFFTNIDSLNQAVLYALEDDGSAQ